MRGTRAGARVSTGVWNRTETTGKTAHSAGVDDLRASWPPWDGGTASRRLQVPVSPRRSIPPTWRRKRTRVMACAARRRSARAALRTSGTCSTMAPIRRGCATASTPRRCGWRRATDRMATPRLGLSTATLPLDAHHAARGAAWAAISADEFGFFRQMHARLFDDVSWRAGTAWTRLAHEIGDGNTAVFRRCLSALRVLTSRN